MCYGEDLILYASRLVHLIFFFISYIIHNTTQPSQSIEKELLRSDFEGMLGIFRSIPKLVDAERLMALAWTIPLKREEIIKYENKVA